MSYILRLFFLLWFIYLIPAELCSVDKYYSNQIIDKNNLIGQPVFNIITDQNGFVWISSRSGVNRYDGRNIKHYSLTQTEIVSDGDGRQIYIRKDNYNRIWAFTDSGRVYFYDAESDAFDLFLTVTSSERYVLLNDIYWDNEKSLWMATSNGLAHYSPDNNTDNNIVMYNKGWFTTVLSSVSDSLLSVGTDKGLLYFDISKGQTSDDIVLENIHITSIYFNPSDKYLWVGTFSSGLFVFDTGRNEDVTPYYVSSIPHVPIKVIRYYDDRSLLVGLDGRGVYMTDTKKETSGMFLSDNDKTGGRIDGNGVYDILVDKKNIWVGTYSGGITIIKEPGIFEWVKHIPYNEQSLVNNHIHAVYEDRDGDIWYATKSGVSRYEVRSDRWKHYFEGENTFLTITEDASGNIWCGGFSTGVYCINKTSGNIRHIKSLGNTSQADCIYASAIDSDKNLWFGGLYNPLTCVSKDKDGKENYSYFEIYQVNSISPINQDTLFVSSTSGFYLLNRQTKEFRHFFSDPNLYNVKSNSFIYSGVSVDDNLWFGTDGGGLNCFNIKTGTVENYSTYNGLPSNYIYGIMKDEKDQLWISSDRGLFIFNPKSKTFVSTVEGLPVKQFVFESFGKTHNGRMIFGSRNGAVIFNPEEIETKEVISTLHFTDLRISYNKVTAKDRPDILSAPIDEARQIKLKYNQNTFSLDFITIDLYDSDHYIYQCKLEGFDKEWISKDKVLTADYMNVPPGKYTFVVRSINSSDGHILEERAIPITISQPFWNTIWAWAIYLIIIASLIYWIWNFYKNRLLQKQSEEKINFFINVAHDIRTPLSLIMAPLDDLQKEENLSSSARHFLNLARQNCNKLLSIVSQLLDFQKVDSSASELDLSLCDFKAYLKERVEKFDILAHKKSIHLYTEFSEEDVFIEIDIKKMDRILDNLLSNAIKYTGTNGEVNIRLHKKEKELVLEVEDNGIGISKSDQKNIFKHFYRADNAINSKEIGSGIGLVHTKKLVELMSGNLSFSSHENQGTIFTLVLPLRENISNAIREKDSENSLSGEKQPEVLLPAYMSKKNRLDTYKILLVEDNDDMRRYLIHSLSADYNIQGAESAESALLLLKQHTVDLVISDVMMPGMSGIEFCKLLKGNIETSHIQIILLTALADKEHILTGLEYGADDYITKPFDVEVLKMKIHNFIKTRKKLQQHYLTLANLKEIDKGEKAEDENVKSSTIDKDFLNKSMQIVTENISNSDFTINDLCRELAMSRTLVYEKLKILTNQSPNEFIRFIRLKRAKELLLTRKYSIQEVSEMTGFSDSKYFSTVFKKYYGETPSKIK